VIGRRVEGYYSASPIESESIGDSQRLIDEVVAPVRREWTIPSKREVSSIDGTRECHNAHSISTLRLATRARSERLLKPRSDLAKAHMHSIAGNGVAADRRFTLMIRSNFQPALFRLLSCLHLLRFVPLS
jgi:hypothetical protein